MFLGQGVWSVWLGDRMGRGDAHRYCGPLIVYFGDCLGVHALFRGIVHSRGWCVGIGSVLVLCVLVEILLGPCGR